MMQRVVLHCDLNNFFASAAISKNPTLKSLPVAVCGDSEKRHGIVLAKNYIAKGFGVVTAETIWEAKRKCPNLIILQPDFSLYEALSAKAQTVYYHYSDLVEPFGIDECWIELTDRFSSFEKGVQIANEIRERVKKELGITLSAGVSYNKVFAKLGSDLKKPDAVTLITPGTVPHTVWPLPCGDLLMVGKSTAKTLRGMGIFTIGDLAAADAGALRTKLGKNGVALKESAMGNDRSPVRPFHLREKPKSIGRSATAERDLTTYEEVFSAILHFSELICERLRAEGLLARTVAVHTLTCDFERQEFQAPLERPTDLSGFLAKSAMELFRKNASLEKPMRAVGVRAADLTDGRAGARQISLFDRSQELETQQHLEDSILQIRHRFGADSVKRAVCMNRLAEPSTPGFYK